MMKKIPAVIGILIVVLLVGGVFGEELNNIYVVKDNVGTPTELKIGSSGEEATPEYIETLKFNGEIRELFNNAEKGEKKQAALKRYFKENSLEYELDKDSDWDGWTIDESGNLIGSDIEVSKMALEEFSGKGFTLKSDGSKIMISNKNFSLDINGLYITVLEQKNQASLEHIIKMQQGLSSRESPLGGGRTSGGGSGGSTGGGSGGGGGEEQFLQALQQIFGMVKEFGGALKEAFTPKKGETSISGGEGGDTVVEYTPPPGESEEEKKKNLGPIVEDVNGKLASVNSPNDETATLEVSGTEGLSDQKLTNAVSVQTDNTGYPVAVLTVDERTAVRNDAEPGDEFPPVSEGLSLGTPLFTLIASLTGRAVENSEQKTIELGQKIELIQRDADISGRKISVDILRTFNNIDAGGQEINVYNGANQIKFNLQRTYTPRLLKKAPYGIKQFSNKLDKENEFVFLYFSPESEKKGVIYDKRVITTITDQTRPHPKNSKLRISSLRESMWE